MNYWQQGSPALRDEAWNYLERELRADVVLATEARVPERLASNQVCRPLHADVDALDWGTAIVDLTGNNLHPITAVQVPGSKQVRPWKPSTPWAAVASIDSASGPVTLICLYGKFDHQRAYANLLRQFADLADLFEDAALSRRLLLAGDLNVTTQWSGEAAAWNQLEGAILQLPRGWWLRDLIDEARTSRSDRDACSCAAAPRCGHVQTFWSPKVRGPRQLDYAFGSDSLVVDALKIDSSVVTEHGLSDHGAVVIDIGV